MTIVLCLAAFVGLGLAARTRRKPGLADYVLAGRTLTLPSFVATLVPTFYGGVLGVGEFTWRSGLSNWTTQALPYYLFAAVYALFLAERIRLREGLTISDHLEQAYDARVAVAAAPLICLLALPADELLMIGALLGRAAGMPKAWATAATAVGACALLWRGGFRADVWTNRLQIVLMFAGFACLLPPLFKALPLSSLPAALPPSHTQWTGGQSGARLAAWWLIAVWTLVDPSFHQRCAAARDGRTAKLGILVSIGCWAVFDLMTTTAGLYARALLPKLDDPVLAFPALADLTLGPAARALFYAGLLSSIAAALQGRALYAAIVIGKDGWGRLSRSSEEKQERQARLALPALLAVCWAMTMAIPSVVGLWYSFGSAIIPGLLLPVLGAYFPRIRRSPDRALAAGAIGFVGAFAALLLRVPVEPMFAGLGLSAVVWFSP